MSGAIPCRTAFAGPIVIVGYDSIGRDLLPLLLRHLDAAPGQYTIIDPNLQGDGATLAASGHKVLEQHLTQENFAALLDGVFASTAGQGLLINLAVEVSSLALIAFAHEHYVL